MKAGGASPKAVQMVAGIKEAILPASDFWGEKGLGPGPGINQDISALVLGWEISILFVQMQIIKVL